MAVMIRHTQELGHYDIEEECEGGVMFIVKENGFKNPSTNPG